ncbi:putative calcium-binding protein CML10-like protein [Corchorus olitorius]|uniref:Calcium-binding protein CML10-like protein n=1 Tax=Corchorus olitorius TaxID=93759 RepID=A0A1R3JCR4_9ROSI|nr:putative calcium-binding protein CML10-like protein [Corchorus olitorius]
MSNYNYKAIMDDPEIPSQFKTDGLIWRIKTSNEDNEELKSTISKYAKEGRLNKSALKEAFYVLNITNPDYAASRAMREATGTAYGSIYINSTDDKEFRKVIKYASTAPRT